ncbi:L,D-transpeptidase/peptidoglycan binding protein [Collinsella sp. zg1085]|uniref:L,D-transpeptidase family protein n=1 Tax=Collinsella sp. zg1085 TaxID=2844380 RepID=UPI001C0DCCE7|nr:L,D-transpeptidase family protein [Collinsella sp. zg1085]QWT17153.1 L,D-transpeptidase/peptidoglycan binding protein [Collinsella sp. zg1085]
MAEMNNKHTGQHFKADNLPSSSKVVSPLPMSAQNSDVAQVHKKGHTLRIVLAIFVSLFIVAYAGGAIAFTQIMYPNTVIAGVNVSWLPKQQAIARVDAAVRSYRLTIKGGDFSWVYTPSYGTDIVSANHRVNDVIHATSPFAWPVKLASELLKPAQAHADSGSNSQTAFSSPTAQLPASFDHKSFEDALTGAVSSYNEGRTGVFDAASAFDVEQNAFSLERALSAAKIDVKKVSVQAKEAIATLTPELELDFSSYEAFAQGASKTQISSAIDAANKLVAHSIKLTLADQEIMVLDAAKLYQWVSFDDKLIPSLDINAATEWMRQYSIDNLDTVATERSFTRADGKQITVKGGTYGWNIDSAALAEQINQALVAGKDATLAIPTKSTAAVYVARGQRDWQSYIDVDLSEQHARYYDNNGTIIWESGIITGNPNRGDATPTGIYSMNRPLRGVTLIGKKDPATGEPIYRTPVAYWMPFVGGSVGFHDATWQAASSFSNPAAYRSVGSHGCVNLPYTKAQELYELVSSGICVVVHW